MWPCSRPACFNGLGRSWGYGWLAALLTACSTGPPPLPVTVEPPGRTIFHVVGLYKGEAPVWQPMGFASEWCIRLADPECRAAMLHLNEHEVALSISDTRGPLILGLSAWERTVWRLHLADGVRLQRVILSGVHPQRLEGLPGGVPLDIHTDRLSRCVQCRLHRNGFYSYHHPHSRYAGLVDQPVDSFQGYYQQHWIELTPATWGVAR